jgi:hypothetical protein
MSERTSPQVSFAALAADQGQQSGRDLRLDLFRGLSLLFIFIDHIPNNVLSYVTLHSIAFSDAAEVFVFIAGYAAATVYGKAFERQGCLAASGRIYRRVWQLYVAHILTFVVLAAGLYYVALRLQNQTYIEDFGIDYFIDEPQTAVTTTSTSPSSGSRLLARNGSWPCSTGASFQAGPRMPKLPQA